MTPQPWLDPERRVRQETLSAATLRRPHPTVLVTRVVPLTPPTGNSKPDQNESFFIMEGGREAILNMQRSKQPSRRIGHKEKNELGSDAESPGYRKGQGPTSGAPT